jgi:hypothetical protein
VPLPPAPLPPAPVAPTNAPRTGGSGGSSNDAARGLQLLLYAVGATIASVALARGRYVFTLPSGAARIGVVPIIERPG